MDIQTRAAGLPVTRKKNRWVVWIIVAALVLVLSPFTLPHVLLRGYFIPAMSMSPTLLEGDHVYATIDNYQAHEPRHGELVVFQAPEVALSLLGQTNDAGQPTVYIKRVIGMPGDHIKIVAGTGVFVNGKLLLEPYVQQQVNYDLPCAPNGELALRADAVRAQLLPYIDNQQTLRVPAGYYLVLGDCRTRSHDSHIWGLLPRANLRGKVIYRYWPPARMGPVH